jgi:hypothetical protein
VTNYRRATTDHLEIKFCKMITTYLRMSIDYIIPTQPKYPTSNAVTMQNDLRTLKPQYKKKRSVITLLKTPSQISQYTPHPALSPSADLLPQRLLPLALLLFQHLSPLRFSRLSVNVALTRSTTSDSLRRCPSPRWSPRLGCAGKVGCCLTNQRRHAETWCGTTA